VSNANLLSIKSLSVSFGGLKALSNINLDLHANEVVGLIGPNGAGKTTLFNALSGLVDVEAGTLEINNKPHKWPKPYGLVDLGISRTLQGVGLFPELTVLENVMVGDSKSSKSGLISSALGLNGKDEAKLKARAMTALERVYASGIADQRADSLPYPVTKRVAIARALVSEPKILLLDEPAGGLGAQDIEWMNSLIHNLSTQCSVILVEHHMDVVMSVCNRLYVLNFGEVIASGEVEKVRRDPAVCDILWPRIGNISTTSSVALATSFLSFRHNPASAKFSFTLNSAITDLPSETCIIPVRAKSSARLPSIELPFQVALPDLLSLSPERVRSNVVLPAPFAPITAAN